SSSSQSRHESNMAHHAADQGLGLNESSWPPSGSLTVTHVQPRSHHPSQIWAAGDYEPSTLSIPSESRSSSQPPDIFSTAYDPFASIHSSSSNRPSYNDSPYRSSIGTLPGVKVSPPPSCCYSHRSSFSSPCPPSEVYSRDSSEHGYTPEIKREGSHDWASSSDNSSHARTTLSRQELLMVSKAPSGVSLGADAYLRENSPKDSKYSVSENHNGQILSLEGDRYKSESSRPLIITNSARIRKRRQLTSPNEATHECKICGKLFGRSYNFKAHLETHDPTRAYPHVCDYKDCEKKFVRKTDLTRHQQNTRKTDALSGSILQPGHLREAITIGIGEIYPLQCRS
ncbi:hypothetical protein GP486_008195, partial [Trichoglossum hirsutum]